MNKESKLLRGTNFPSLLTSEIKIDFVDDHFGSLLVLLNSIHSEGQLEALHKEVSIKQLYL